VTIWRTRVRVKHLLVQLAVDWLSFAVSRPARRELRRRRPVPGARLTRPRPLLFGRSGVERQSWLRMSAQQFGQIGTEPSGGDDMGIPHRLQERDLQVENPPALATGAAGIPGRFLPSAAGDTRDTGTVTARGCCVVVVQLVDGASPATRTVWQPVHGLSTTAGSLLDGRLAWVEHQFAMTDVAAPRLVHRTARIRLRLTCRQPPGVGSCCARPGMCGRGCWTPTGSYACGASPRLATTRHYAASSPAWTRSGSCR
jgi:hypothetical protein